MDDQGDDWGDTVGGFDVGDLTPSQRDDLSTDLTAAGILHAFVGPELKGPGSESELIEHLIGQTRRGGRRRAPAPPPPPVESPLPLEGDGERQREHDGHVVRSVRSPWGPVPPAAVGLSIAARWRRFVGYLIEALALGLVTSVLFRYSAGGARIFGGAMELVSSVVLVATFGATFGMMVLRMRLVVITSPGLRAPGWRIAIVRYLVAWWPVLLLMVLSVFTEIENLRWLSTVSDIWMIVCFGPILLDPAHRGLHDRIAGTVVVDVPRHRRV